MPIIEPITKDDIIGEITPRTSSAQELLKKKREEAAALETATQSAPEPQKTSSEAAPEATKPEQEITAKTSPQDAMRIAAAIRKEKQLREREKAIAEQQKSLEEREKSLDPWKKASEMARLNKLEALKLLGISYDDLTQQVLNNGEVPPTVQAQQTAEEIVNKKLAELERKQAERDAELQKQNYEQALKQIDFEVEHAASQSDKFPLVKGSEAFHDVTEYIESEFHRTGKILPVEVALAKVEQQILEGLQYLAKEERIKALLFPKEEPKTEQPQAAQPEQKITTLTHRATVAPPSHKPLTDAERRQRAIDAFYGKTVT